MTMPSGRTVGVRVPSRNDEEGEQNGTKTYSNSLAIASVTDKLSLASEVARYVVSTGVMTGESPVARRSSQLHTQDVDLRFRSSLDRPCTYPRKA